MASFSESQINEFNTAVEEFIINCLTKIMYYHSVAGEFKSDGFEINYWLRTYFIQDCFDINSGSRPYDYKIQLSTYVDNEEIKNIMIEELRLKKYYIDELNNSSFGSILIRYCYMYAICILYKRLIESIEEYIQENSNYSEDEDDNVDEYEEEEEDENNEEEDN